MKKVVLVLGLLLLAGCSTMQPPRYAISADNVQALKKFENANLMVTQFTQSADFNRNCRLMGPIQPADGLTFPEFLAKAFNDEIKMAGIYSDHGTKLTGDITKVEFSSSSGLTNGFWDISIILSSSNGNSLLANNKYTFKSGFNARIACNETADALTPAVQDIIHKAVSDPRFEALL